MTPVLNRAPRSRPVFHDLQVSQVQRLTPDAVAISFAVPPSLRPAYAFEPGQHLTLRAMIDGQDVRRSYSLCLSRAEVERTGWLRVASSRVTGGAMSSWLNTQVSVGDTLAVLPPLGDFTCPVRPDLARHHVALAAGSGITPVLSLITTALEDEPASRVTLAFGNRTPETIMFRDELADLQRRYPQRLRVLHFLSSASVAQGWEGAWSGEWQPGRLDRPRIEELTASLVPIGEVDEWYLCGPVGMVHTARAVLAERGADPEHVHHEIFFEGEAQVDAF